MARPVKQGIDYFPFDVDFFQDMKVRKIMKSCGSQSASILIRLLCNIYKEEGYYILWDEDLPFLISDDLVGVSEGAVTEVILKAIQVGFFDQKQSEENKILTSNGIQNRFKSIVIKRKEVRINSLFLVNDGNNSINDGNNLVNDCQSTQSKVKERKEKKREREKIPPTEFPFANLDLLKDKMLIPISECEEEMLCDEITLNATAMHYHLDPDLVEIRKWVKSFFSTQRSRGEKEVTLKDSRKYFSDWLNVQLGKQNKQSKSNITNLTGKEVYTKF